MGFLVEEGYVFFDGVYKVGDFFCIFFFFWNGDCYEFFFFDGFCFGFEYWVNVCNFCFFVKVCVGFNNVGFESGYVEDDFFFVVFF